MIEYICSFEEEYGFLVSASMKYGEELIRCKDCSYHYGTICRMDSTFPWEDDDYCSKAEVEE